MREPFFRDGDLGPALQKNEHGIAVRAFFDHRFAASKMVGFRVFHQFIQLIFGQAGKERLCPQDGSSPGLRVPGCRPDFLSSCRCGWGKEY